MAATLRLRRMGRRNRPIFSIIVVDSRKPRDGAFIEDLGRYYPLREPAEVTLDEERAMYWLRNGVQPSDTVRSILSKHGLMLRLHLERKGTSAGEIDEIVSEWKEEQVQKEEKVKVTAKARRQEALEEERKRVEAEEKARAKAEAEAKAKAEAEAKAKAEAEAQAAEEEEESPSEEEVEAVHEEQAEAQQEEVEAASEEEVEEAQEEAEEAEEEERASEG